MAKGPTMDFYWPFPWLPDGSLVSWQRGIWVNDRWEMHLWRGPRRPRSIWS